MSIRKMTLGLLTAAALVGAAASLMGCSSQGGTPTGSGSTPAEEDVGSIGLALQLTPGFTLATVSYTITGPKGFATAGSIDVSHSTKISALISSLPAGAGYSVTLSATSLEGLGTCLGSAGFNIAARQTTPVTVRLTCHEAARTGSVLINGQVNICPVIDGVSASPGEVLVGADIALSAAAHDGDAGPKPLSYSWTASSGTLSNDSVANPIFTCGAPGTATLSVTVSDGDPVASCADTSTVTVECSPCAGFDSITAALGELTADCRGRVDPRDYQMTKDGFLAPAFDNCGNKPQIMTQILQLLSLQKAKPELLPNAQLCIGGRFKALAAKFASRGIDVCPTWSDKLVLNPITQELVDASARAWPDLSKQPPPPPPPGLTPLKEQSAYTVTLPAGINQKCGTPSACAAACADVFPGFVVQGPVIAPSPNSIVVDPMAWWSQTSYAPGSDPFLNNAAYYHQMSYVAPSPTGEKFGALVRWDPCGMNTCVPEACSYWAGTNVRTRLQQYCNDYSDPTTCTSYCGAPL